MTGAPADEPPDADALVGAVAVRRRLLAADPHDPDALHRLGAALHQAGQLEESARVLAEAVRLSPINPHYRVSLAATLGRLGQHHEAIGHLVTALTIRGDIPELHNNLGASLEKLGRLEEAAAAFRNALKLRPDYLEAHRNLGNVLRSLSRPAAAAAEYEAALAIRPGDPDSLGGLSFATLELADAGRAVGGCRELVNRLPDSASARSALLYNLHYCPEYDAEALCREHREWGTLFCEPLRERIKPHENDRDPGRRLRIGYVSPDLREHTVTKFVTAPIQYHDREQFEVLCYSDAEKPDHVTGRMKQLAENWRETRKLSDLQLDELIRNDQIDILVDLRGHAADNRLTLFARKPAPVQINMVGYFNTTGLSAMDYRLTDMHMDPPAQTEHLNVEKLIRIDPSCWCYTPEPGAPDVAEPPFLKNGYITFGSLNKIVKVSEPCGKLWARVLEAAPTSRLLLSVAGDAAAVVRERLGTMGLPVGRIDILDKARTPREYLERFNRIDIALDTFPFNGITTTCDGLWMGVPCVSLAGAVQGGAAGSGSAGASPSLGGTSVSRAGKSIVHAAKLPELCADMPEQFVRIATELAKDRARLRDLRLSLRDRLLASPLMDHRGFARKLQVEYRKMWQAWCNPVDGRR